MSGVNQFYWAWNMRTGDIWTTEGNSMNAKCRIAAINRFDFPLEEHLSVHVTRKWAVSWSQYIEITIH